MKETTIFQKTKSCLTAQNLKKLLLYLGGLLLIAVGANLAKLCGLGISPATSIPRACEVIWGWTLGTSCQVVYLILMLLQIVVLRKNFKPIRLLSLLLTFVFGWMVDFTGTNTATFGHLMAGLPRPGSYPVQLLYLVISILLIGVGVMLYVSPKWPPLPAEGLADALSTVTGKTFGDCKTLVDTSCIVIALILQLIFMGGLSSFTRSDVVVREGTVISALCVGQVVKLLNKKFGARVRGWMNQ